MCICIRRQKNMELAATALVAAALEDKDEGADGSDSGSEHEGKQSYNAYALIFLNLVLYYSMLCRYCCW